MTSIVNASKAKVAVSKTVVKGARSGIELAIFFLINNIMDDNGKNLRKKQVYYCFTGGIGNNVTKD